MKLIKLQKTKIITKKILLQIVTLAILSGWFLTGCHLPIDKKNSNHACLYLYDNPYIAHTLTARTLDTQQQALILAVIAHESNNAAFARPVKRWLFKPYIPWEFYSSAQSYAQSTNATWLDFKKIYPSTPIRYAYHHNVAFIDWYFQSKGRALPKKNYFYEAYFLYHDGSTGYRKKSHKRPKALVYFAKIVSASATRFHQDLQHCQSILSWETHWSGL